MIDECDFEKGIRCGISPMLCHNCEVACVGIRMSETEIRRIRQLMKEQKRRKDHGTDAVDGGLHTEDL
jgi:hypothetical protein